MKLPLPNLDDRRWIDLAEEGRNLIPRYAPEWTDFNVHDPGITLIELFAWLTEMNIFRLNQIPEAHRRKFLAMLGITPRLPQAASTVLEFLSKSGTSSIELPATTEIEIQESSRMVRFRTLEDLTVVPIKLSSMGRNDQNGRQDDLTLLWENGESLAMFGTIPHVGSAFCFGFSGPLPRGKTITLYLRFSGGKGGVDERQRLQAEWLEMQQDCPSLNPCQPANTSASNLNSPPMHLPHHSVRTVWEIGPSMNNADSWKPLNCETGEIIDETRACTLDGFVRVILPSNSVANTDCYLRCRLVAGEYDEPPILQAAILNAVSAEQAVPVHSEFTIAKSATISGPKDLLLYAFKKFTFRFNNAGEVEALTFLPATSPAPEFFITRLQLPTGTTAGIFGCELRILGKGLGEPSQKVVLQPAPVQSHSVGIFTLKEEVWQVWSQRSDFDASTRSDHHFTLDPATGIVTFGDGEKGIPVPRDALIIAKFRNTDAELGNFLAGKIWQLSHSAHNQALINEIKTRADLQKISNPIPVTGGEPSEDLTQAEGRAFAEAQRSTRAVTINDIEHLTLTTPGTHVARAAVKPNLDARYPGLQAPGVTTVLLLPQNPVAGAQPSPGLKAAVQRYLNRRRILGNRIIVAGPVYTKVAVTARVKSQTEANRTRVRQDILQALHHFFDPLHGGPAKTGWPFGRDVYRSEVLHVIDSVTGVENVIALELIANDGEPSCGNVNIGPCGLVISGAHEIVLE